MRNALFVFLIPIAGIVGAFVTLSQGRLTSVHVVLFLTGFLLTGLGITVGYHRLLTHRSFETHGIVKAVLLILGSMAVQGQADRWVANHVKHHAHADRAGDPHSPREGLLHAHWGWLLQFSEVEVARYAAPVRRDRVAAWISDTFVVWVIAGYAIPVLIGGWEGLIWGGLLRQVVVQNVTFSVNSVCHRWGQRPFPTEDQSKNNWIVGLLGLGEGWHNNHHAFPTSAYHGLRWWEFDLSGYVIRLLRVAGMVWNVRRPNRLQIQSRAP